MQTTIGLAEVSELEQAFARFNELTSILMGDFSHALAAYSEDRASQVRRRAVVLAAAALFEGTAYALKQNALAWAEAIRMKLSLAEQALLRDEAYSLDRQGRPATDTKKFLSTAANLRFAFDTFAKVLGSSFRLVVAGPGWQSFRRLIEVRHRLAHPKAAAALEISEKDYDDFDAGFEWFITQYKTLLNETSAGIERLRGSR